MVVKIGANLNIMEVLETKIQHWAKLTRVIEISIIG
jgi:hypothetical protein